ncbi:nucleotidyltransferase domain-containing protein [archaeon]|nr:nucleotidyltransferase domain-containing protein [archaeon]
MRQETALKIIALLRKDLDRGITILEISKRLKIGYRPAYNHVSNMEKEDIIAINKVGNAKQCFLNLENAKCRHFLAETDMLRKEELLKTSQKLKDVLENLTTKLNETNIADIHSIVLFGSYAKSTATKSSDVDLLFIVADIKDKSVRESIERECTGYQYSHNVRVSPLITDVIEFKKMLKSKELNVGKEARAYGLPLYGSEVFWRLMT